MKKPHIKRQEGWWVAEHKGVKGWSKSSPVSAYARLREVQRLKKKSPD